MTKSIPHGLLAIAVATSLVIAQDPAKAGGWSAKAGSGLTYDDGNKTFGFNWLNFVQASWSCANNEDADDTNSFDIPVARTQLRGHVFNQDITFRLQMDLAESGGQSGSILKDACAQYASAAATMAASASASARARRCSAWKAPAGCTACGSSTARSRRRRSRAPARAVRGSSAR